MLYKNIGRINRSFRDLYIQKLTGDPTAAGVIQTADGNFAADPLLLPVGSTFVALLIGMIVVVVGIVSCQTWRKSTSVVDSDTPVCRGGGHDNEAVVQSPPGVSPPRPPSPPSPRQSHSVACCRCRPSIYCGPADSFRRRRLRLAAATVYLVVKLSYSIVVTFTVASVVIGFYFRSAVDHAADGGPVLTDYAQSLTAEVDRTAIDHIRQNGDALERAELNAGRACVNHVDEISRRLRAVIGHESASDLVTDDDRISVSGVVSRYVGSTTDRLAGDLKQIVTKTADTVDDLTKSVVDRYRAFLIRVADGQWTAFGRALFNRCVMFIVVSLVVVQTRCL